MLFQLSDPFLHIMAYLPTITYAIFDVAILIFGNLMYKKNSYDYGKLLMISAILSMISAIIYIAIDFQYLSYNLFVRFGLEVFIVNIIMLSVSMIFLSLNTVSAVFLILALHKIFETHRKSNRTEIEYE